MKCSYFTGTSEKTSLDEYELRDIKLIKKTELLQYKRSGWQSCQLLCCKVWFCRQGDRTHRLKLIAYLCTDYAPGGHFVAIDLHRIYVLFFFFVIPFYLQSVLEYCLFSRASFILHRIQCVCYIVECLCLKLN
jgi:hypothetical protein